MLSKIMKELHIRGYIYKDNGKWNYKTQGNQLELALKEGRDERNRVQCSKISAP